LPMAPAGRQVELAQIPRHALLNLLQPALHLRTREILVARVHRLELAAVNRHARARQQTKLSAKRNEPRTYLADRRPVSQGRLMPAISSVRQITFTKECGDLLAAQRSQRSVLPPPGRAGLAAVLRPEKTAETVEPGARPSRAKLLDVAQ